MQMVGMIYLALAQSARAECECSVAVTTPSSASNSGAVGAAVMPWDLTTGTVSFRGRIDTTGDPPIVDEEGQLIWEDMCSWEITLSQDNANDPNVHVPTILGSPAAIPLQEPGAAATFNFSLKKGTVPLKTGAPARMRVTVVGKDDTGAVVANCQYSDRDSDVCAYPSEEESTFFGWSTKTNATTMSLWLGEFEGLPTVRWEEKSWVGGASPLTRQVRERSPTTGTDQCWDWVKQASTIAPILVPPGCKPLTKITGGTWDMFPNNSTIPNHWGFEGRGQAPDGDSIKYDYMGTAEDCVLTYQQAARTLQQPGFCSIVIEQSMDMDCRPDSASVSDQWWVEVERHPVIYGVKAPAGPTRGRVYIVRDGMYEDKEFP